MNGDTFSYVMDRMECREKCTPNTVCNHITQDETISFASIFKWWLWNLDANEEVVRYVFTYNTVQLTGIYLSRELAIIACNDQNLTVGCMKHNCIPSKKTCARDLLNSLDVVTQTKSTVFIPHDHVLYTDLTLRQYRDVMESIQWQWRSLLYDKRPEVVQVISKHLDALFCLFGYFISVEESEDVFDDTEFTEFAHKKEHGLVLHATAVKTYIHLFFILYRSLFLARVSTRIEMKDVISEFDRLEIQHFHVEASIDDFYNLSMFFDIAPACYLDYKHAFSGFFNNVSQAVYRHYPTYKRKNQETLENINEVLHLAGFDVNVLPCLRQLYPEIEYAWEDHFFGIVMRAGKPKPIDGSPVTTFFWYCLAGDFYLVTDTGDVYAADNVVILTAFYMKWSSLQSLCLRSAAVLHS
jgi:hypothetical protein